MTADPISFGAMVPTFGRDRELARVEQGIRHGLGGRGALLLVTGEPGIGKTRVLDHAARVATEAGAAVAWGRCWEAGGAPAYWPFVEVFRSLDLSDPFARAEAGEAPSDARFRFFDTAVRQILEASRRRPLALVLDDLHAADVPSLLLLQLLVRGLRGAPLAVIGTYRDTEARRTREVGPLLAKIAREGEVLALAPLSADDVAEWLKIEGGEPARSAEVHRLTEGNPLFVKEILRLGTSSRPARLSDGLGAVLDEHLARVSQGTRMLLECGAILGREFTPGEAGRIGGVDAGATGSAISEAEQAALLAATDRGRWAFVHVLVRDRLAEELSSARRAELHWRAGEAVLASRADLVSAAHHFIEGHAAGSVERVLEAARDAAERCLVELAFEGAVELGERALGLVSGSPPTRQTCALVVVVAEAHLRAGALATGKERCVEAARIAKGLGAPDLLARAALAYGSHFATATVDPVMVSLLEDALAVSEPHGHPIRARLLARLSAALVPPRPEDAPRVLSLGREAIAMARRLNDSDTLLYALRYAASGFAYQVGGAERGALMEEIVALARRVGNRGALFQVLGFHAGMLLEGGRRSEALAVRAEFEELLTHFPQPHYQWGRHALTAVFACLDGDVEAARGAAEAMRREGEAGSVMTARVSAALLEIALAHASGVPSSIAPVAEAVLAVLTKVPTLLPYTAWVLAAVGRADEAREMLGRVAANVSGFPWLIAAADAAVVLRDPDLATRFYPALLVHQFENRLFWGPAGAFCLGPTPRTLGDLAMLLGRPEDALRHYENAVSVCERVGSKPLLGLSRKGRDAAHAALAALAKGGVSAAEATRSGHAGASAPASPTPGGGALTLAALVLRREGEVWSLARDGAEPIRLKDGKGVRYLERLLATPRQDVYVLELVGSEEAPADAGAVLDGKAKELYRKRLEDLRDQLEEATRLGDPGRAGRAQAEIDAIADQLASAVGLGGRDRKAASNVERARINVQRRLRDVLGRIAELDPVLGRYLEASVRTGTYCSFSPP